jgi:hypothetical protein
VFDNKVIYENEKYFEKNLLVILLSSKKKQILESFFAQIRNEVRKRRKYFQKGN